MDQDQDPNKCTEKNGPRKVGVTRCHTESGMEEDAGLQQGGMQTREGNEGRKEGKPPLGLGSRRLFAD